ncbi:MAG: deoxyhypusine synthase [Chloroherpetonaceae bacterium]|nr:deoxyhypusine synthase [Chloroherpetonaceae bacterium]MDW8020144.1 deoxyhypusine synthase [Chloroherpetonaceae bacterium]
MPTKQDFLRETIEHLDMKRFNVVPMVEAMAKMAFQARNLSRAAKIYDMMLADKDCAIILTLAGSLISAGLKQIIIDLVEHNMVDAIVATGANIVDQDFFEALGFRHYIGTPFVDDRILRELHIDRIYDTFIDEDQLRICDETTAQIFGALLPKPYSSRELMIEFGKYLEQHYPNANSIILSCYRKGVPIFVPALSDCSAGFGIVHHQWHHPDAHISFDSGKDFLELTRIKIEHPTTGIFMIGGGVPKNFTQDIVVAAEVLGFENVQMHKYAVQLTVADERDGALSGSTLKEASSWGKVDTTFEQMVFGEATVTFPLVAGYAYHKRSWEGRKGFRFNDLLATRHTVAAC